MYTTGDRETIGNTWIHKLALVAKYFENKKFAPGDNVTYVDFYFYEFLDLIDFVTEGKVYTEYPVFNEYHGRVADLPNFKEYLASDRFMKSQFNNKSAKLNN